MNLNIGIFLDRGFQSKVKFDPSKKKKKKKNSELFRQTMVTCAENEPICGAEKHVAASDIKASPPRLPPLELDPVGDSGSGIPQWRLKEEEDEEVESAGLGRRKAG